MMKKDLIEITTSLIGGAGVGAALMYLLDPQSGQYRREHLTDTAGQALSSARQAVHNTKSDISHSLGHALSTLTDRARALGEDMSDYAAQTGQSAKESARETGRRFGRRARRYLPAMMSHAEQRSSGSGPAIAMTALGALALGAGIMYVMDPTSGRRRRAVMRDKAVRYAHETTDTISGKAQDLSNRARGLYYKGRKRAADILPLRHRHQGNGGHGDRPLGAVEEQGQRTRPSQIGGV
jgi:gas vesicle protein